MAGSVFFAKNGSGSGSSPPRITGSGSRRRKRRVRRNQQKKKSVQIAPAVQKIHEQQSGPGGGLQREFGRQTGSGQLPSSLLKSMSRTSLLFMYLLNRWSDFDTLFLLNSSCSLFFLSLDPDPKSRYYSWIRIRIRIQPKGPNNRIRIHMPSLLASVVFALHNMG